MFISEGHRELRVRLARFFAGGHSCAIALVFLCAGILCAKPETNSGWSLLSPVAALALAVGYLMTGRVDNKLMWVCLGGLFFVLGLHLTGTELNRGSASDYDTSQCSVVATVSQMLGTGQDFRILLLENGFNQTETRALPACGRLFLRHNSLPLIAGDVIGFRSRIRKPTNRGNPGEFDWETYCRTDNILWLASVSKEDSLVLIRQGNRWHPRAVLFRVRESMRQFLDTHSGTYLHSWLAPQSLKDVRTFLKGIVLGDRSEIRHELRTSFSKSGLIHQLSASGVHVAIVVLFTLLAVKMLTRMVPAALLWFPLGKLTACASIATMSIYCLLVGANTPAVRSTIMGLVVAVGILIDKRWDSSNSLALAALLILLSSPLSLFAVDFQLSFLAVAGIFAVLPVIRRLIQEPSLRENAGWREREAPGRWHRISRIVRLTVITGTLTSVGATLAVTPLVVQLFHSFPVYTVFANLAADSVLTLALFFGLLASVVGLLDPSVASVLLVPADLGSYLVVKISDTFSSLPGSTLTFRHLSTLECILLWSLVIFLIWGLRVPSRRSLGAAALSCLCLTVCFCSGQWLSVDEPRLKVVFLNVGKGDAAFVEPRGSHGLLIDGGPTNEFFDSGRSILLPFLLWNGTRSLDGLIISHPEMDHMGGLLSVIPQVRPARVWWNPVAPVPPYIKRIVAETWKADALMLSADRARQPVKIGHTTVRFFNTRCTRNLDRDRHRGLNDAAVVCRVECGNASFLFTGDLEREGEEELVSSGIPLAANVLKVGHHGSRTSTTRQFLEAVHPDLAVISCDYPRTQGLPAQEILHRLDAAGVQVFWTGRDGAVTMETDGRVLVANTGKSSERRWTVDVAAKPGKRVGGK